MKRIIIVALGLAFIAGACGPADTEPRKLEAKAGGRTGQALTTPAGAIVPTEVGADGLTAGRTTAIPGVSPDGAATYNVPLWLPAGRAGLQPELSLEYTSHGGNSPLGLGWNISGLSRVSRCPRTMAQDGNVESITFTSADAFCLDGQRLVAIAGTYGASNAEYRTENESFSRIVSLESDGAGPSMFRIYLKNGRILTYGKLNNSTLSGQRIVPQPYSVEQIQVTRDGLDNRLSWALSHIEDRNGNFISFHYTVEYDSATMSYEQWLSRIDYTGSSLGAGMPATRSVEFDHGNESRPDTQFIHVAGFKMKMSRRLKEIRMRAPNPTEVGLMRSYRFSYEADALSGLSLLSKLQECDGAGVCMRPTSFAWTPGNSEFEDRDTGIADLTRTDSAGLDSAFWILSAADVDGDGRDDLLYRKPYMTDGDPNHRFKWVVRYSASNYSYEASSGGSMPLICKRGPAGSDGRWQDVNFDGRTDVSIEYYDSCDGVYPPTRLMHYLRTAYEGSNNWFAVSSDDGPGGNFWFADLNGDGLLELVRISGKDATAQLSYRPNVAGVLQPYQSIVTSDRNDNNHFAINLDGSSKTSLLIKELTADPSALGGYRTVGARYWAVTQRNGIFEKKETTLVRSDHSGLQYLFLDITGDGLPDAVGVEPDGTWLDIFINTGNGFSSPTFMYLPSQFKIGSFENDNGIRVIDYNNDGRQDLLLMDDGGGTRTQLVVLQSNGSGFTPLTLPIPVGFKVPYSSSRDRSEGYKLSQVLDVNGDGLTDLAQVVGGTLHFYVRKGQASGLLSSVVDGMGARVEYAYKPMIDPTVYTPGSGCTHPQSCLRKGMWLVSEYRTDTGVNGLRTQVFSYEDGRKDVLGRGWLGFAAITVKDALAGTEVRSEFGARTRVGTHYPYASRPVSERHTVTNEGRVNVELRSTQYDASTRSGVQGTILTVLPKAAQEEVYDRLATEPSTQGLLRRIDTVWQYDWVYGNLKSKQQAITGGDVSTWSAQYDNDETQWLIGLPRTVSETNTVSGASVTRTESYEYYLGTNLLKRQVTEPGDAQLELATSYTRDADGLVTHISAAGPGYPVRTFQVSYDILDRTFPATMTNGLGHTVSVAYHGGLGVLAAQTDENSLLTQWQYDGFGRIRKEDAPAAADITTSYSRCADASGCSLQVSAFRAGGQEVVLTYDRLGRSVGTRKRGFSGEEVSSSNQYDALGRLWKAWMPSPTGQGQVATTYTYDNMGRPLEIVHPDGTRLIRQYEGNKITSRNEKNNEAVLSLDVYGRPAANEDRNGSTRIVTRFEYGPFGLPKSMLNGYGQGSRFEYDRLGRRTVVDDSDSGRAVFRYNPFGEIFEETDGNGDTKAYVHDALGRVLTTTNRDGVSRFVWDEATFGIGKLARSIQEGDSTTALDDIIVSHTYDTLGQMETRSWTVEGAQHTLRYEYDTYGRLMRLHYPGVGQRQLSAQYEYSTWGHLKAVWDGALTRRYWSTEGLNGANQLTAESFGNGVTTQRRYDLRGRLLFIDSKVGSKSLQTLAYEYEANGNLRSRHDRLNQTTEDFAYDALDRLTRWTAFQNCRSSAVEYSYDDIGNLLGRSVLQDPSKSISYFYEGTGFNGAGPHAVTRSSEGSYTYDRNGNQLTAPSRNVAYTTFNLPSRIWSDSQSVTLRYDAFQTRTVKRSSNGDETLYIGGLYEKRSSPAAPTSHVFSIMGAGRPVAQVLWTEEAGGSGLSEKTLYLHTDHLGSVESITDESGHVVERLKYEPFGGRRYPHDLTAPLSRTSPKVRQGFTGHEHDEEFGLINMGGRMYDSTLGRFLSPDPLIQKPLFSQSQSRYSYVFNNPLRFTDPSGYAAMDQITVYDSWYGGWVSMSSPNLAVVAPRVSYCEAMLGGGSMCVDGQADLNTVDTGPKPSAEFQSFYDSMVENMNRGWAFAQEHAAMGFGIAYGTAQAAAPFGALGPSPAPGNHKFEVGRAIGLGVTGIVQGVGAVGLLVGGEGAQAGGLMLAPFTEGASLIGIPVGAVLEVGSVILAAQGTMNVLAAANVLQMAGGYDPDQAAIRDLIKTTTNDGRKPLPAKDAETILDWAEETKYPGARAGPNDVTGNHPGTEWDGIPHIHIPGSGKGGHVQVEQGVQPRPNMQNNP